MFSSVNVNLKIECYEIPNVRFSSHPFHMNKFRQFWAKKNTQIRAWLEQVNRPNPAGESVPLSFRMIDELISFDSNLWAPVPIAVSPPSPPSPPVSQRQTVSPVPQQPSPVPQQPSPLLPSPPLPPLLPLPPNPRFTSEQEITVSTSLPTPHISHRRSYTPASSPEIFNHELDTFESLSHGSFDVSDEENVTRLNYHIEKIPEPLTLLSPAPLHAPVSAQAHAMLKMRAPLAIPAHSISSSAPPVIPTAKYTPQSNGFSICVVLLAAMIAFYYTIFYRY